MRSFIFVCLLGFVLPSFAQQATTSITPLSDRLVSYTIKAELNPDTKTIKGTQRLTWRNPDSVPVDELQFHLYLNAFKDDKSTFMKESGGVHRGNSASSENPWGGIDISSMRLADDEGDLRPNLPVGSGLDLTDSIEFIHPDDDNADDQTVFLVKLPRSVAPGETLALDFVFESRLPEIIARTGWEIADSGEPFFFVGQWFPKIAVLEIPGQRYVPKDAPKGEWNAHQFHANSEFYADFGTYDVTLDVPESYEVGASGIKVEESIQNGIKTLRYKADDVIDFAWTASPDFLEYTQQWRHVFIRALIQPAHKGQAQRHIDAAIVALERYDEWIGEYPYTTLTVVDGIGDSNGMEYPTLITAGTTYGLPTWARVLELVTIHEFGHQYFMGLLASNEFEEAWLDEGMNSYIESRIVDDAYGRGSVIELGHFKIGDIAAQRLGYVKQKPSKGALITKSWEYTMGDYGKASYAKPATVMNTLERYWGWDMQQKFLKAYYAQWRFKHPSTRDLQDVAEQVSGEDLDWFFDQFVYGTAVVDYAIDSISNTKKEDDSYSSRVRIWRKYDGIFPVSIRLTFADGSVQDQSWDGQDEWKDIRVAGPSRLVEAFIDPEFDVLVDINRLNNRKVVADLASNQFARQVQFRSITFYQKLFFVLSGLF
ncbi:M1 family metallopeptidase [bacterium]|nr:M1 family metallopeptidase [bacterium]